MGDKPTLVVRADADSAIGAGHVMRTLALSQAWQEEGGRAVLAAVGLPAAVEARLRDQGIETVPLAVTRGSRPDAVATADVARSCRAQWIVLDGYHFGAEYQRWIKESGLRLVALDDCGHATHYWADLVLNQNPYAEDEMYRDREAQTRLLLGSRFALLRREFWPWRGWKRVAPEVARRVLVTLGGGDAGDMTEKGMQALNGIGLEGSECVLVAGPMNRHSARLEGAAGRAMQLTVRTHVSDMAELMAWADIALGAAGSTSLECAFMGLPVLLAVVADNQEALAGSLGRCGAAVDLGRAEGIEAGQLAARLRGLMESRDARRSMTAAGMSLVDGYGAARVVQAIRAARLRLRDVTSADDELLWRWANDPGARANSLSREAIPWDVHREWLSQRLHDPGCRMFIAVDRADVPVGQVRLDADCEGAVLSISIDKDHRRRGLGLALVRLVMERAAQDLGLAWVDALILRTNDASLRMFDHAGFRPVDGAPADADSEYARFRWYADWPLPAQQGVGH